MVCVRENTEGEYCGVGGFVRPGDARAEVVANEVATFTRAGNQARRRYAFELARTRPKKLLRLGHEVQRAAGAWMVLLWDEVVEDVAGQYQDVTLRKYHVDALAGEDGDPARHRRRDRGERSLGDVLTDLGGAFPDPLAHATNRTRRNPSMFEPIHGSAPDIAGGHRESDRRGMGRAMIEHLGEKQAAIRAIEKVTLEGKVQRRTCVGPPKLRT